MFLAFPVSSILCIFSSHSPKLHKNNATFSGTDVLSTHFHNYMFKFSINLLTVVILSTFNWNSRKWNWFFSCNFLSLLSSCIFTSLQFQGSASTEELCTQNQPPGHFLKCNIQCNLPLPQGNGSARNAFQVSFHLEVW
jgi:hypothetical protein